MTIRFLILSDTHDEYFHVDGAQNNIDVVLHCGDMTMIGGLSNYKKAISRLAAINAEIKIVIPGNHDVSLDPEWWAANLIEDEDDPSEPEKAAALFNNARESGIQFLSGAGAHTFTLKTGLSFSLYASPYTPDFNGYAFPYFPHEDVFNEAATRIPEHVAIIMTHGPGLTSYTLDLGRDGEHCGCPKLFNAVRRVKPLIHCFGHIHEGYGVQSISWEEEDGNDITVEDVGVATCRVADSKKRRGQTILVNAAISRHGEELNKAWMIDLEFADDGKASWESGIQDISIG
ncbi:Metallo-dependent phosphatase-like protein [Cladorrhinum sp. PSN332]|nr:Metallo-dependent phosphatase-like protein [Cladorrhinum sp. PSN332]